MEVSTNKDFAFFSQNIPSYYQSVSSIIDVVKDFINSKFPKSYFKNVSIETAAVEDQTFKNERYEAAKVGYPNLVIGVNLPTEAPEYMAKTHLMNPNYFIGSNLANTYAPLMNDTEGHYAGGFSYEYKTIILDFKINVDTYLQAVNITQYLRSVFQFDAPGYLNGVFLEFEVPKSIVKLIANLENINLENKEDFYELDEYLLNVGRTHGLIKRKTSSSTGQVSYYAGIKTSPLLYVESLQAPETIQRNNMSEGEYQITFQARTVCLFPNTFILKVHQDRIRKTFTPEGLTEVVHEEPVEGVQGLRAFTLNVIANKADVIEYKTSKEPYQKYIGSFFWEETFTYGSDEIDDNPTINIFEHITDNTVKKVHAFCIENNIDVEQVFHVEAYKKAWDIGNTEININYDTFSVDLKNAKFSEILVRIYINRPRLVALIKAMKNDLFFYNKNALCYITINVKENNKIVPKKVKVNFFNNKQEMYNLPKEKQVCVNTIYGIGYINIRKINPKDIKENMILVCLDIEQGNKPIIYELVGE